MRLLFVAPCFPIPIDCGQHVRTYNLIQACARRFEVTFIGPPPVDEEGHSWIRSVCAATHFIDEAEAALTAQDRVELAKQLPGGNRSSFLLPYLAALQAVRVREFDVIFTVRPDLSRLLRSEAHHLFVDLDDVTHLKLFKQLRVEGISGPTLRSFAHFLLEEVFWARRLFGVSVCSHEDRRYLQRWGLRNVAVVPNGTTIADAPTHQRRTPGTQPRLVFVGNMAYGANADAVNWFADRVLPLLRQRCAHWQLDVIGPNVPDELARSLAGRVRFVGFVEHLPATLATYDIAVAPLRFGGGTKLKVLDALAAGVPLVTTPVGAEGLGLQPGTHTLVAASASDFADAILCLVDDTERAQAMAARGRAFVESVFPWPAIQTRLADLLVDRISDAKRCPVRRRAIGNHAAPPPQAAASSCLANSDRPGCSAAQGPAR